jgi:hypothetical protein
MMIASIAIGIVIIAFIIFTIEFGIDDRKDWKLKDPSEWDKKK